QARPGDAAGLGAAVDWPALGWPDWALYQPIAQAALDRGAEIVAADLSPAQRQAVFRDGPEVLQAGMVRRTGLDRNFPAPLAASLAQELRDAHCGRIPEPVVAGKFRVQRARDAMMADRLATVAGRAGGVLIAGNGHIRTDRGVPWYLARIRPMARTVSVAFLEVQDGLDPTATDLPFDYVWFTPRVDDLDPCAGAEGQLRQLGAPSRS
ncbi:MAG TPA: ChaN family lipoprotein, partial [Geminicoccaceae bacterium]|nr:ChaN family lipoprotein [Geminicoccaceae bacterium]